MPPSGDFRPTLPRRGGTRGLASALIAGLAVACSPTLDWRDARVDGGLTTLFPCKPAELARDTALNGRRMRMTLLSCTAGGASYSVSHADVRAPDAVAPALAELRSALAANVGALSADGVPLRVPGMTPGSQALRLRSVGHLPDGTAVEEHAALFARGTHIYQAVVLGAHPEDEAVETFFGALKLTQ